MTDLGTNAGALRVGCPRCNVPPTAPCVYLWPKDVNPMMPCHSVGVRAKIDKVGKPTRRPHNERLRAYTMLRRRARREVNRPPVREMTADTRAAARAQVEFDRAEYEALRRWFAHHGHILTRGEGHR